MSRPTLRQAISWQPDSLEAAAGVWDAAATDLHRDVAVLIRGVEGLHEHWRGSTAAAARTRMTGLTGEATRLARVFVAAAAVARSGAQSIGQRRDEVLAAVAAARAEGYPVADDGTAHAPAPASEVMASRAAELSITVGAALDRLGVADEDTARDLDAAFRIAEPAPTTAAGWPTGPAALVAGWPTLSQEAIAAQIAALSPEQRQQLVEAAPRQAGNTDGVPWPLRIAANRLNIADAILTQRGLLERSAQDKARSELSGPLPAALTRGAGDPASQERVRAALLNDPAIRARAAAAHDRKVNARIEFYQGLLADVPDPTGRSELPVPRQFIAFDPQRSSLIELHGDLRTATNLGVLIPGLNTTLAGSAANVDTARRFTRAGGGRLAMISYLGGEFPTGTDLVSGIRQAAEPGYAERMAPRLVAFSEDVKRTVDGTGRIIPVTYLGHSYGGSILGTAERDGLTADRTVYVAAAGAGVGVHGPGDWHNRNPDVRRFSMTAPLDWIEAVQGIPFGPHGADPDTMAGVIPLGTGRRADGSPMMGPGAHSGVVNDPSDAWNNLLAVLLAGPEPRRPR